MFHEDLTLVEVEEMTIFSVFLNRVVRIDLYRAGIDSDDVSPHLLLINDGQDLVTMGFGAMLHEVHRATPLQPLLCIGIHASEERRMEYGTAAATDYAGRGAKAALYNRFILEELLPWLADAHAPVPFLSTGFAGFSLGGLTAIDMIWNHPSVFSTAGVFSGSLWWRAKDVSEDYDDDRDRIMHQQVRHGKYTAGLRFYFTTGSLDEVADRNNNGVIDSIDDTLSLIEELRKKGYEEADIRYINFEDGRHDVPTWRRAMPEFLRWGWAPATQKSSSESC